jgi:hypothetical protein
LQCRCVHLQQKCGGNNTQIALSDWKKSMKKWTSRTFPHHPRSLI